jgi:hypothetical protein
VKKEKMKKAKLTGVVAIAMVLTIAFSGVALASHPVPPTKETETLDITTNIKCNGSVVESQRLSLEIDSGNLIDNPPLANNEKYGKIGYNEKMIGLKGTTTFDSTFEVDTGTTPNLNVTKNIGYSRESGDLGSLSHDEQVGLKVIFTGKAAIPGHREDVFCPFDEGEWVPGKDAVPGCYEEVNAYSTMVATDVDAEINAEVGITGDPEAPVTLNYKINAIGAGLVTAGVDLYVEDGRGAADLGSKMSYRKRSTGYGENVNFTKNIRYNSVYKP